MHSEGIRYILQELGCQRIKESGSSFSACCPFAPYGGHKSDRDRHPSFSIKVNANGESPWNCFTCQRKGTMRGLIYQLEQCGKNVQSLRQYVNQNQEKSLRTRLANIGEYSISRVKVEPVVELENGWYGFEREVELDFKNFEKCLCIPDYAIGRGLSEEQCIQWKLGIYNNRLFIPVFAEGGKFVGYSLRALSEYAKPKYMHVKGFKKEKYLYGENFRQKNIRIGFMMEGFSDVWNLARRGLPNCFAIMGTRISKQQIQKLVDWCDEIIIFRDNDKAPKEGDIPPGLAMARYSEKILKQYKPSMKVLTAPVIDGLKDVGDATDEQINWLLQKVMMWRQALYELPTDVEGREKETQ